MATTHPTRDAGPVPARPPHVPRRGTRLLRGLGTLLAVVVVVLVPVRLWVAEPLRIVTGSMAPTLRPGEHVLAWKLGSGGHTWRRGEIVTVDRNGPDPLVKRVIGLAGDTVAIRDGRLLVDGHRVHEPYADPRRIDGVYFGPVRVPAGQVFVLGDDRRNSEDSRDFGAVPVASLRGTVLAVVWPVGAARDVTP